MKKAWITLLTQPSYLPGVIALQRSLRLVKSEFPLVIMVTPNIDETVRESLLQEACLLHEVLPLSPAENVSINYASPQFSEVWTKLRVWGLVEFNRVVFLDADMLVLRNMDELFEVSLPPAGIAACHACRCNPHHRPTYPASWEPKNCFYTYASFSSLYSFAYESNYFNAGLLVLAPDIAIFAEIENRLFALSDVAALPFAEQDLLNVQFSGNWLTLPYIYNALKPLSQCHSGLWDLSQIKNLHFILDKPWMNVASESDDPYAQLNHLWRNIYFRAET